MQPSTVFYLIIQNINWLLFIELDVNKSVDACYDALGSGSQNIRRGVIDNSGASASWSSREAYFALIGAKPDILVKSVLVKHLTAPQSAHSWRTVR